MHAHTNIAHHRQITQFHDDFGVMKDCSNNSCLVRSIEELGTPNTLLVPVLWQNFSSSKRKYFVIYIFQNFFYIFILKRFPFFDVSLVFSAIFFYFFWTYFTGSIIQNLFYFYLRIGIVLEYWISWLFYLGALVRELDKVVLVKDSC